MRRLAQEPTGRRHSLARAVLYALTMQAIELRCQLGDRERQVVSCALSEGLSDRTAARVVIATDLDDELDGLVAGPATLAVHLDGSEARRWTLVVAEVELLGFEEGQVHYAVELRDRLWLLDLGKSTRKFRKLTTEQIVDRVLAEAAIDRHWRTTRATAVRNWCVQYRETHLAFVERLLAFEGIAYRFDADGAVVFVDDSRSAPPVPGPSSFEMIEATGALTPDRPGILELARGARVAPGTVTVNDMNWKTPGVSLLASAAGERDRDLEIYDFPSGHRDPHTGPLFAQLRLEAARSEARYLEGSSNALAFAPGHRCAMSSSFEGSFVLVRVAHRFAGASVGEAVVYRNRFDGIPAEVVFRPPVPARPLVAGHHTAMVRGPAGEEIHTDSHGRFKVQFHWDREATGSDEDSRWLRILQEAGSGMALARVGWEMNVGYIDGDPDRPVGLARNINGAMAPTYSLPDNKTMMTMRSPSSPATGGFNELSLDDRAGAQRFAIRAERDFTGIVNNDRSESIAQSELHVVGVGLVHTVAGSRTLAVAGDRTSVVNGHAGTTAGADRGQVVAGDETVSVASSAMVSTGGCDSEHVGAVRMTIAGGLGAPRAAQLQAALLPSPQSLAAKSMMAALGGGGGGGGGLVSPPSLSGALGSMMTGLVSRATSAGINRMVGGVMVSAALGNIATQVKAAHAETVGGVKVTVAREGIAQKVGGVLATTVGGAMLRSAAKDIAVSGKLQRVNVGAMASIGAGEALVLKAKTVSICALTEVTMRSGDVSIAMTPDKVTLSGDVDLDAGGKIEVVGAARENLTSA